MSVGNQALYFPAELHLLYSDNTKKCDSPDCVISTILCSTSFNPYINIKENTIINTAFFESSTLASKKLSSSKIQKIYEELHNSSKYEKKINKKKIYSNYISVSLRISNYSLREKHKMINTTLAFDNLATKEPFKVLIEVFKTSDQQKNSLMIPVYYIEATRSWSNAMCLIEQHSEGIPNLNLSNIQEQKNLKNYTLISCSKIGSIDQFPYPRVSLVLAIDCLEDLDQFSETKIKERFFKAPIIYFSGIILLVEILWVLLFFCGKNEELVSYTEACEEKNSDKKILDNPSLAQYTMIIRKIGYLGFIKKRIEMKKSLANSNPKDMTKEIDNSKACILTNLVETSKKSDTRKNVEPESSVKEFQKNNFKAMYLKMINDLREETCCRLIIV